MSESKLLTLALRDSEGYLVGVTMALNGGILDMDEWFDGNGDEGTLEAVETVKFEGVMMSSSEVIVRTRVNKMTCEISGMSTGINIVLI